MSTKTTLSRKTAEACLAAVKDRYCTPVSMVNHGHDAEHTDYETLRAHMEAEHGFGTHDFDGVTYASVAVPEDFDHALAKHAEDHAEENLWGSEPTLWAPESGPPAAENGWAIIWEMGPDDWAYQFCGGGSTETERVMMHDVAVEFGLDPKMVKVADPEPGEVPAGVFVEPYASYAVGLYPA